MEKSWKYINDSSVRQAGWESSQAESWDSFVRTVTARPAGPGAPQALQGEERRCCPVTAQRWGGERAPLNCNFLEDFKMNKDWWQTCGKA